MNFKFLRSLEVRITLLVTLCSALILCSVGFMTYLGINQILLKQQDNALADRINRLEILLQDSENVEQIIARPKLYQNMLGNQDNLFLLIHKDKTLININPLHIQLPELAQRDSLQFQDLTNNSYPTRIAWKTIKINDEPYLLIAGKQWSERINILLPFQESLLMYVVGGVFAIFVLCILACHLGLRSLQQLRKQTHSINVNQLQKRLNLSNSPLEVELLSKDINHMLERIEKGYTQLNRFSEDIAHEFRTPLNNLIGQTEIALTGERSVEQYEDLLVSHLDDYHRLKRMIDSMLFLARADQKMVLVNKQEINIQDVIDGLCQIFEYQAEEQDCHFSFNLEAQTLFADPELFQRAVYNLVLNALVHGGDKRTIYITTKHKMIEHRQWVSLTVVTGGISIADHQLEHLFERFYQCHSSRSDENQTGGLGLSIVASIMDLHHGRYKACNTVEGVCFELDFPVADAAKKYN
ncbi:heavy metal sensor histidine kinase [Acinetobacter pittii]|uniref:heavy metal sensor histidine kinase n=1 Tax=Acinetobacter pittii TaxID=48296 RepID=UPI0023E28420|nr:heavy metal sensor histidine kinase [Acinetobacter pittii]MDF3345450.1 heavy metal sensor histidine kinase [Acinetobacter pittii]